jgi:hypothetical protein
VSDRESGVPALGAVDRGTLREGLDCLVDRSTAAVRDNTRAGAAVAYFLGIAFLVLYPLLGRGYVLSLDMVFAPDTEHVEFLLRTKGPLYYGRLPVAVALDALGTVLAGWVVQKLVLLAVVSGSGLAAYAALDGRTPAARLFAGTLYAINPFVYARLLAGQWYVLLGYVFLPVAVVAFVGYLSGKGSLRRALLWTTVVAAFDPHTAVLLAFVGGCTALTGFAEGSSVDRSKRARRLALFLGGAVAVNAYWLLPALVGSLGDGTQLSTVTTLDAAAFSARGTIGGNVLLSVAMLYGFWRGGALPATEVLPPGVPLGLFACFLFLATYGWLTDRDAMADGLALAAIGGFVLALGVSYPPTAPLFRWLFEHLPVVAGMRDSQKFVALLVLAYALLGGRGVDRLLGRAGPVHPLPSSLDPREWRSGVDRRAVLALGAVVLLLAVPLGYTVPMLGGLAGQLDTTEYPEGWHAAEERFEGDDADYRVLFLPWHQYVRFSWIGRTVATPADHFFDPPVVHGRNLEVSGVESQATDPTHARLDRLLAGTEHDGLGRDLAPLGIKYVLLSKDADFRRYGSLREEPGLTVVLETEHLLLLENVAFDDAPPESAWPRAGMAVPWRALLVGVGVSSVAALGSLVRRRRFGR